MKLKNVLAYVLTLLILAVIAREAAELAAPYVWNWLSPAIHEVNENG